MGSDDTIERRRGAKIQAQGMDRAPGRSSHRQVVQARGWRWLSLMLLVPLPGGKRGWALPFLTGLAPAERDHQARGQPQKKLTAWARPRLLMVRRWGPERSLVWGTESRFAVLTLLWRRRQVGQPSCRITRGRLAAALYEPAPPRLRRQHGRPRLTGKRWPTLPQVLTSAATCWTTGTVRGWYGEGARGGDLVSATAVWYQAGMPPRPVRGVLVRDPPGKFEPQALLWTDLPVEPGQILEWLVLRWQLEVTWQEARAHRGREPPRPWKALAVARTTPTLLGLVSRVTLFAGQWAPDPSLPVRQAVWSHKPLPTFAEVIAVVRQH